MLGPFTLCGPAIRESAKVAFEVATRPSEMYLFRYAVSLFITPVLRSVAGAVRSFLPRFLLPVNLALAFSLLAGRGR